MLGFVALVAVLFVVDRQVFSLLKTTLGTELNLSDVQYGWLVTAFMVPYTVMYLFTGAWIDRWGTQVTSILFIGLMSLATILTGVSDNFYELFGWRVLLGVAEAGVGPASILLMVIWFPKERLATAVALKSPIAAIGQVMAPPLIAWITLAVSWRAAFIIPGSIGLSIAAVWWFLDRNPPDYGEPRVKEKPPGLGRLLRTRRLWPLFVVRLIGDPFWFFLLYWHPGFLQEHFGLSLTQLGQWAWIPPLCKALGNVGIGIVSDWLVRRGFNLKRARSLPLVAAAALAPLAWLLPFVHSIVLAVALISLLYVMCGAWLFLTNVFVADLVPRNAVATGVGLLSALGGGTAVLFNLAVGPLVESTGYIPLFLAGACLHPIAAWVFWRAYARNGSDSARLGTLPAAG